MCVRERARATERMNIGIEISSVDARRQTRVIISRARTRLECKQKDRCHDAGVVTNNNTTAVLVSRSYTHTASVSYNKSIVGHF